MFRALLLLAALTALAPAAAQAFGPQTIGFVLGQNSASTERLPFYRSTSPIGVSVAGDVGGFDTVSLTAEGPGGVAIRTPLERVAGGYRGDLRLATPGTWHIALTTRLGAVTTKLVGVPLHVVAADGTELAAGGMFALAICAIAGGLLMIARARTLGTAGFRTRS